MPAHEGTAKPVEQAIDIIVGVEQVARHPDASDSRRIANGHEHTSVEQLVHQSNVAFGAADRERHDPRPTTALTGRDDLDPLGVETGEQALGEAEDVGRNEILAYDLQQSKRRGEAREARVVRCATDLETPRLGREGIIRHRGYRRRLKVLAPSALRW